jgi:hypothetical protein
MTITLTHNTIREGKFPIQIGEMADTTVIIESIPGKVFDKKVTITVDNLKKEEELEVALSLGRLIQSYISLELHR